MNKFTAFAVTLGASVVLLSPATSLGAEKKSAKAQPVKVVAPAPLTQEEVAGQVAYLDKMHATLKNCRALNSLSVSTMESMIRTEIMMGGNAAAAIKKFQDSPNYKRCEKEATADFLATSRDFMGKFRDPKMQDKAKDTLAQWMTALDAVPNSNFDQEVSKFATLANGLKLELSLN
jgi:hypothetical protein